MTILVPVDGSANSDRAVTFALDFAKGDKLHFLNVQAPVSGAIKTFVKKADVDNYHREEGEKALASALKLAAEAGVAAEKHISVGRPGAVVAQFAKRIKARMVVVGTRGHTGLAGVAMGSFAQDVIAHSEVPVCLVK